MPDNSDVRLVFLDTAFLDQGAAIRGAVLVTDMDTRPYEFRCTSPVKPTPLQRILYGDTLDEYVHVELIALPLLSAAKERPTVVLVRNPTLLKVRPGLAYPTVLVRAEVSTPGVGTVRPVIITGHPSFPAEASAVQAMLAPLMQKRDVLEPFERLTVALTEAHKQGVGDPASSKRA